MSMHDNDDGNIILPIILHGKCLAREFTGDEGSAGGVAHLFLNKKRGRWFVTELDRLPWLYTAELTQSPEEVAERIISEVEAGKNVWFPKPAGWV